MSFIDMNTVCRLSVQVVFNYEGITERKRMCPVMTRILKKISNNDYNDLRPDLARKFTRYKLLLFTLRHYSGGNFWVMLLEQV